MWKEYFGPKCHIYGVDVRKECVQYEDERIRIFVGDQSDRSFWTSFKREVPKLDIIIDDGGHLAKQQIVTLQEMLPHLQPGGVYLCEDVHGDTSGFSSFVQKLGSNLNEFRQIPATNLVAEKNILQTAINSIHHYPFVFVFERSNDSSALFIAEKRGDQWR